MSIISEINALIARFEASDTVHKIESDIEEAGSQAWIYIKANGLTALVSIARQVLLSLGTGTPYSTILATVVQVGEQAGIQILQGAEAVVVAAVQADLIASGELAPPIAATTLEAVPLQAVSVENGYEGANPAPLPDTAAENSEALTAQLNAQSQLALADHLAKQDAINAATA